MDFYEEESDEQLTSFGASSQVECFLSQDMESIVTDKDSNITNRSRYYKESLPLFEQMVTSCKTDSHFQEMCQMMRNHHMIHHSIRGINAHIPNENGIVLFGENNTTESKQKRHKFRHEKHQRSYLNNHILHDFIKY